MILQVYGSHLCELPGAGHQDLVREVGGFSIVAGETHPPGVETSGGSWSDGKKNDDMIPRMDGAFFHC